MWADWEAWRRQVLLAESLQAAPQTAQVLMGRADVGLAGWLTQHRYLQPVDVDQGECSMALLLLWEVEHGRSFPTMSVDATGTLLGFTRRLLHRVAADSELKLWLMSKEVQRPLAPGLPDSHHTRWSVRVCQPPAGDPQGWYEEFTSRWRQYLRSLAQPVGRTAALAVSLARTSGSTSPTPPGVRPLRGSASGPVRGG